MERMIDARGLSCPQPVILTKKALEGLLEGSVITVVDNSTARENVVKLARILAYEVEVEERGNEYHIRIEKSVEPAAELQPYEGTLILIKSQYLGEGNDELGKTLMKSFLFTLTQMDQAVKTIIFLNSGVALTTQGSEVLDHLLVLEHAGVKILSCGTCLDFYNLKNQLMVGSVTNMYSILENIVTANRVLTL